MFKMDKKRQVGILSFWIKQLYKLESYFYNVKNINYPKVKPAIFALWHAHQCMLYANEDRGSLNVMISKSNDGDIIAAATNQMGIKTVRGSQSRHGAGATLELLEKLEQGESAAITIDGPRGPKGIVKEGVIHIAKISQVPIVPQIWYSPSRWLLKFKTWDEFNYPFFSPKIIAVYGDPIYVPSDCSKEDIEFYRKKLEDALNELYSYAKENFKELSKNWKKTKHR